MNEDIVNLKLHNLRAIEQGAICGLLFGILSEIGLHTFYIYERYSYKPTVPGLVIDFAPYPYNWWTLPLLWLVLVALSSYLVHRYLARYIKSSIWLWQVIGIVAVLEFCLFSFLLVVYGWYSQYGDWEAGVLWEAIVDSMFRELKICLFFLPSLLAFNLIFALVLHRRKWQFQ